MILNDFIVSVMCGAFHQAPLCVLSADHADFDCEALEGKSRRDEVLEWDASEEPFCSLLSISSQILANNASRPNIKSV